MKSVQSLVLTSSHGNLQLCFFLVRVTRWERLLALSAKLSVPSNSCCHLFLCLCLSPAPPKFLRTPNDQTGLQGGVASFICQATGDPRPKIVWNKKGKKVSNQRFEVLGLLFWCKMLDKMGMLQALLLALHSHYPSRQARLACFFALTCH